MVKNMADEVENLTFDEKEARERIRQARLEQTRRLTDEKLRYYVPTGVGKEFIDKILSDKYFVTLFSAANGVGKTCIGANLLANILFPGYNPWFDYKLLTNWKYPKRARIISDPTTITSAIIPELKAWFPAGRYKADKKGKNYEYNWTTDTGWEFEIMSYDQDPKEFESATLGFVWLDEPPPETIYKATVSRMRRGGIIAITATPLTGSAWIYDQVISNPSGEDGRRTYLEANVESACIQHGERGFLEHSHIEQMIAEYSEDEMQARVHGKFQHLIGLVYKQWDKKIHCIRPFKVDFQNYTVYQALDVHDRLPDFVTWIAVDKNGQKFVIDELFEECRGGTKELAERIKAKDEKYRVVKRIIDPKGFIVDQHTKKSVASRLAEFGLSYQPASKKRTASDRRIGEALDFQRVGNEFIRTPELYYFDTCHRSIFEIEHWRWDEWTGKAVDKHNKKETKVDKDDHSLENIGRILLMEPRFENFVSRFDADIAEEQLSALGGDDPYA